MLRLRDLCANTPTSVPYTEDQIMAMVRKGKQQRHIPGVGRVLAGHGSDVISINEPRCTHTDADVDEVKEENKWLRKELNMMMIVDVLSCRNTPYYLEEQIRCLDCRDQYAVLSRRVDTSVPDRVEFHVKSDGRMSQLLTQPQSPHEVGGGSGSDGGGDDEPGADENAGGDEDADGDEES
ncbi:hypothetical protein Tco_0967025 [Tanacetum coccineum]